MVVQPGSRIGAYEIVAALGRGGMGEVYRARDTKLQSRSRDQGPARTSFAARSGPRRAVPARSAGARVAESSEHRRRSTGSKTARDVHRARHGIGRGADAGGPHRARTAPLDHALPIARQIAEALEAAHEQGIIHRDLKPANIKVTPDGTREGARLRTRESWPTPADAQGAADDLSNSPTMTAPAMTQAGMILGTAAYMAPEQARGKAVDKRADIWAFGVVLYEMLTGRAPFAGEIVHDDGRWPASSRTRRTGRRFQTTRLRRCGGCWRAASRRIRRSDCATSATRASNWIMSVRVATFRLRSRAGAHCHYG